MQRFKTVFLSDIHLGTAGCQAAQLLSFLKEVDADRFYLVGDVIDGWRLKKGWYWPQAHNDVVQKLLRKARKGAEIKLIAGNHDEFLRSFLGTQFGKIEITDRVIHRAQDGKRYLVIHGDQFDVVVRHQKWLALLGDGAYTAALWLNTWLNHIRRKLGFPYWSLSKWAKLKVKNAVSFIGSYEQALAQEAAQHDLDGVICGHIHHAVIDRRAGIIYCNTGDWVESCTAIVEHDDGSMALIRWAEEGFAERAETAKESDETVLRFPKDRVA